MKRTRFAEVQIIAVLKEHETGIETGDLARKHGNSDATLYNWKAKFGGMDGDDNIDGAGGRAMPRRGAAGNRPKLRSGRCLVPMWE